MSRRSRDGMLAELKRAGFRVTRQRVAVIDFLAGRDDHPSARQVYRAVAETEAGVSLATIYNTLATLVEMGLIRELEFEGSDNRYDTNLVPHLNLVCITCGEILDVPHEVPVNIDEIRSLLGFETSDVRMEYRGLCRSCIVRAAEGPSVGRKATK